MTTTSHPTRFTPASMAAGARFAGASRSSRHPGLNLLAAWVALATLTGRARDATAQPDASREQAAATARQRFDEGRQLAATGQYEAACSKLELSLGLAAALQPGSRPPPPAAPAPPVGPPDGAAPAQAPAALVGRTTRREGYPHWIMAGDAAALVFALVTNEPEVILPALSLSAPIVHMSNGNHKLALASLALRGGSSLMLRFGIAQREHDDGYGARLVIAGLIGIATAVIVDYSMGAKTVAVEDRTPTFLRVAGVAAHPTLSQTRRGDLVLGLQGTF
jgi:hypothetical protein